MADDDVEYKHGDIAWVKLGNCWWPGEVVSFDELPESVRDDLTTPSKSKQLLAVVKFFQEDSYEYVKKSDKIYPYNCSKKDEFIKKGLDMHRSKKSNMEKFPEDVIIAEKRTGGDENIVNDPKYMPKRRSDIYSEIFGTPNMKTTPKVPAPRGRRSKTASAQKRSSQYVTHPRFIGKCTDHQRIVLLQPFKRDETKENNKYKCAACGFISTRLDAIVLHHKTHLKSDPLFNEKRKKVRRKRRPKNTMHMIPTSKTNSIDEDLALLDKGFSLSSDTEHTDNTDTTAVGTPLSATAQTGEPKRKKRRKRGPAPAQPSDAVSNKKPAPNIRNDLLAEWDDADDGEEKEAEAPKSVDDSIVSEEGTSTDRSVSMDIEIKEKSVPVPSVKAAPEIKESVIATPPPKEKKSVVKKEKDKEDKGKLKDSDFNAFLDSIKMPELPAMPTSTKALATEEAKSPSKAGATPEVATKLTNPKKRFVKSFEDFEMSMKEKEKEELVKKAETGKKPTEESATTDEDVPELLKDSKMEEIVNDERRTRRSSARDEKLEEKVSANVEQRKTTRRSEVKPLPLKENKETKDKDVEKVSEEKQPAPKAKKEDVKSDDEAEKVDKVVAKKEVKPTKEPKKEEVKEIKSKKEETPSSGDTSPEEEKPSKPIETDKSSKKSEKEKDRGRERERPKPKEKILTEIDVFGSLRAQENEKYKKRSEDSPRRETRASRSKSRSESSHEKDKKDEKDVKDRDKEKEKPKVEKEKEKEKHKEAIAKSTKKSRKDDTDEEQVSNGSEKDEMTSPLISKMKNKLMNMLAEEPKSPKTRRRTHDEPPKDEKEAKKTKLDEEVVENDDENKDKEVKDAKEVKGKDKEKEKEVLKSPEAPARRHSLRASIGSKPETIEEKPIPEKKVPTKAEVKSPATPLTVTTPAPGKSAPKTYLRASRNVDQAAKTTANKTEEVEKKPTTVTKSEDLFVLGGSTKEKRLPVQKEKTDPTLLVASAEKVEKSVKKKEPEVKKDDVPLEPASKPEKIRKELPSKVDVPKKSSIDIVKPVVAEKTKEEVKETPPIPKAKVQPEEKPVEKEKILPSKVASTTSMDWLTNFSPLKKKPSTSTPSKTENESWEKQPEPEKVKEKVEEKPSPAEKEKDTVKPAPPAEKKPTPVAPPTKSTSPLKSPVRSTSPIKSPVRTSPTKETKEAPPAAEPTKPAVPPPTSPIKTAPASPVKVASPAKTPPRSPMKSPMRSPPHTSITMKSPIKSPPLVAPKVTSPMKSPPIILNKDAPKVEFPKKAPSTPKKDDLPMMPSFSPVKSPQKVSLNSQELSIEKSVDKVEVTVNNNDSADIAETLSQLEAAINDVGKSSSSAAKDEVTAALEKEFEAEVNATVVPKHILDEGQVEFAKIIEDGTEKVASIPTVSAPEEKLPDIVTEEEQVEKGVSEIIGAVAPPKNEPIINSRLTSEQDSTSKLLEVLMGNKPSTPSSPPVSVATPVALPKVANPKFEVDVKKQAIVTTTPKGGRILTTATAATSASKSKPTILSNTIIKRADSVVSVKKVVPSVVDDIENIDTFMIKKPISSGGDDERSKPKILQQTIITPGGRQVHQVGPSGAGKLKKSVVHSEVISLPTSSNKTVEEKVYDLLKNSDEDAFDIDSMPIVLSDQPLMEESVIQPESTSTTTVKRIPQVTQPQIKSLPKQPVTQTTRPSASGTPTRPGYTKVVKGQRVYQTTGTPTLLKQNPTVQSGKPGKFVIVPSASSSPTGSKYTVGKRQHQVVKKPSILASTPKSAAPATTPETSGSKIMIVTNQQGQRSRVLLTPEQASRMGYQTPTQTKKIIKTTTSTQPGIIQKERKVISTTPSGASQSPMMTIKKPKVDSTKQPQKKFFLQGALPPMKGAPGQTRTVIIKDQQGNIVNRIHGSSDEDIEKQIAEQLEAINRAANAKVKGTTVKRVIRKTVPSSEAANKPPAAPPVQKTIARAQASVPPLAPISPVKKAEPQVQPPQPKQVVRQKAPVTTAAAMLSTPSTPPTQKVVKEIPTTQPTSTKTVEKPKEERQPKQLVIQDAMGNETTIMEGQILALPSETVDGQPQSYMLVTLDETGSLTPLNNEALMSLDPNLNLGGDLSNMVLQIEGGNSSEATPDTSKSTVTPAVQVPVQAATTTPNVLEQPKAAIETRVAVPPPAAPAVVAAPTPPAVQPPPPPQQEPETLISDSQVAGVLPDADAGTEQMQAVACSINKGDIQQQLIITGDPVSTQKFLDSLRDGNPEIAQLLAQAEGSNILIHTDGQQILINTDADNQMLMLNQDAADAGAEATNPIFASQAAAATKNQDILAAALADTDVFQPDSTLAAAGKAVPQAQLSPGYPLATNNVLETSTVNSPIMTPLEVPSAPTKKSKSDVLHQLPSNVDLPITVTDPHIAQTVANQQVTMIAGELAAAAGADSAMELPLSIGDVTAAASSSSADMNSPNFAYSLAASLDDAEKFTSSISMPLLTEDPDPSEVPPPPQPEQPQSAPAPTETVDKEEPAIVVTTSESVKQTHESTTAEYFLATDMMSTQMSSLSEPPPDMFEAYDGKQPFCHASDVDVGVLMGEKASPKRAIDDDDAHVGDDAAKRPKLD